MKRNEIHLTCSTVELQREELPSRRQGSNLQPGVYQTNVKLLDVSLEEAGVRFERTVSY